MATLDNIIEMQRSGMTDNEIASNLQSQGVSPKEINDSLNQAKIKTAVTATTIQNTQQPAMEGTQNTIPSSPQDFNQYTQQPTQFQPEINQYTQQPAQFQPEMNQYPQPQPSIMQEQPDMNYPSPQNNLSPSEPGYSEEYPQETYGGGNEYYEEDYGGGGRYTDTETITEIAEQVVTAKFKEFKKKTGDISIFQNATKDKIVSMEERIKRLENTIDKLQHAVIQKIGEFGENTNIIKKDLENLHNTTSKLMNPLIDNYRQLEKITKK